MPIADMLRTRGEGSSVADVRTFWCKKIRIFQNLWNVRMDKREGPRGVESARSFSDKGGGSIFCDFVRTSFMDGP